MEDSGNKRSQKAGLPPGTLIHIGRKKAGKTKFSVMTYSPDKFNAAESVDFKHACVKMENGGVAWINIEGLDDVETLKNIGEHYEIHPLILEDILTTDQRPKIEIYDDYMCIIARMIRNSEIPGDIPYEQVSIILGKDYVISFTESQSDLFKPIQERIRNNVDRIRKMGADYLAYTLLDFIVDNYFNVLEVLDDRVESLEEHLVMKPTNDYLESIHHLKRQMIIMHKSIWPMREVVGALDNGATPLISESLLIYARDLHDHVIQVMDSVDTMRDILSSLLDIYLSSVSKKLNEVMKVLTIISTIFIPLTFIVGIYGMNFKYMPELDQKWTYPALWLIMLTVAGIMIYIFKRKKWW